SRAPSGTVAALYVFCDDPDGNPARAADSRAECCPTPRVGTQLMVHMQGGDAETQAHGQPREHGEEKNGIDTTAQGRDEMVSRLDEARKLRGYARLEIRGGALIAVPPL